jgi:hypothetical protein
LERSAQAAAAARLSQFPTRASHCSILRSSHEFLITLRVTCHLSRVTRQASRCFRYGFTEVPGGSAWANKSVLSWHNSVLGSITPDDTCAPHAVTCIIARAFFVHVLHTRVCCALVPTCMRPSANGKTPQILLLEAQRDAAPGLRWVGH